MFLLDVGKKLPIRTVQHPIKHGSSELLGGNLGVLFACCFEYIYFCHFMFLLYCVLLVHD